MRTIDADAALKALRKCQTYLYDARDPELKIELSSAEAAINNLPTIQPVATDTNVGDKISRQQAIELIKNYCENGCDIAEDNWCPSCQREQFIKLLKALPTVPPEPQWISVTERLPDNADHPGALCPRYQVVTPYGVTEGWYRPHDHEKGGQWFALFWFMSQIYEIWNIDFERGDVPKVIREAPVMEWRPLPEPYKPNK